MDHTFPDLFEEGTESSDSSSSSSNSNLSARPKGLSSTEALSRLIAALRKILNKEPKPSLLDIIKRGLNPVNEKSLFPATAIVIGLLQSTYLFTEFGLLHSEHNQSPSYGWQALRTFYNVTDSESDSASHVSSQHLDDGYIWFAIQGGLILLFVIFNIFVNIYEGWLGDREMKQRVDYVVSRLEHLYSDVAAWTPENYPHLHTPLSSSVVLQWTLRNGSLVNLPWALLVDGDVIYIKPGQVSPGKCRSLEEPFIYLNSNEVFHMKTEDFSGYKNDQEPKPRFRKPLSPQLFVLEETPYTKVIHQTLARDKLRRPASVLWKYSHLFFRRILCHWICPALFVLVVIWNIICHVQEFTFYEPNSLHTLLLLHPVGVTLPLLSLSFPVCWILANHYALAKLLCMFGSFRHLKITDDPFDDNVGNSEVETSEQEVTCSKLKSYFFATILGTGEFLSRTENIVHTLGSITALCCTDKKGVLSWPNSSAEKIFLLKRKVDEQPDDTTSDFSSNLSSEKPPPETPPHTTQIVAEILNVTHDHSNPFHVEFDDPNWKQHMGHLKPLGLSILLNTCNVRTEERYTNFYNHLTCESMKVGEQVSERRRHHEKFDISDVSSEQAEELASCIDVLPIVTRGCICDLSRKIGLTPDTTSSKFKLTNQIQTFRHVQTDLHDKFARHLSLANLKFPFPHMVSVMVDEKNTHAGHLISQGTADIILDACVDLWTGSDLEPLTDDVRKKILDFYHRSCLSAYCTAFAYRPLTFTFPKNDALKDYLQLPTHNIKFYSQHSSEDTNLLDADIIVSGDISQWERRHQQKSHSPSACLELECNQTFLGMVQLEYQARVEMVQLVDIMEKACIRFVHFSRENELRSRVFSEKMGLESGWNCHISLRSRGDKQGNKPSVTSVKKIKKKRRIISRKRVGPSSRLGVSEPSNLERQKGIFDYLKWHEFQRKDSVAVFKTNVENERGNLLQKMNIRSSGDDSLPSGRRTSIYSHQASVVSDSDPFDYDMSNRAQLPEGIENIRPHLESMDNVPLLVSLFTDCTPETTAEMVVIMQEYGEVVCMMGSSAQFTNIPVFLQSDASLAIEPLYPQICQSIPVFTPPTPAQGKIESTNVSISPTWPAPVAVSQLLNSVASSLSFRVEDEISLFHLILEARSSSRSLINTMQYWVCASVAVCLLQLASVLMLLPLYLSTGETLWLSLIFLPILSMSLLGNKVDPEIMNVSTGKNVLQDIVNRDQLFHVVLFYCLKFLPAMVLLTLAHVLSVIQNPCNSGNHESLIDRCENSHFNLIWTELYLIAIAFSFLFRGKQLWQRNPYKKNRYFIITVVLFVFVQLAYSGFGFLLDRDLLMSPNFEVWLIWGLGLVAVVCLNELIKRHEIKVEVRYQKRQRLEFQTKLGINSPF